ncbi:hypothetical protein MOC97_08030 [Bacillus atrophaeus]|uniref:hypothetical protein n=1 Tax=Bacillus atrophaeus TaxID=1452 RepID=UPI0022814288|nr:hypothetical protein [Bacillus atrophaeus]MCY8485434.1 hypothetical protein [Bacillus atrophaeus]
MILLLGLIAIISTVGFITGLVFLFFIRVRKTGKWLVPVGFVVALICFYIMGSVKPDPRSVDKAAEEPLNITTSEASDEKESLDSLKDNSISHTVDWSENINGAQFKIDQIYVEKKEIKMTDGSISEGVIAVHFIIDNGSNNDLVTFPTQGKLLTNTGQQIEADSNSEDFDGDIMSGAKRDGYVLFPVNEMKDENDIKSVRVQWSVWPNKEDTSAVKELNAKIEF